MVTIADEADFLNAYLALQSVRFPGRFTGKLILTLNLIMRR